MYALTYCYEGCMNTVPFALTIAVSEDRHKLVQKMQECVSEDIEINEDDPWSDSCNFGIFKESLDKIILLHRNIDDLYICYEIQNTKVL